MAVSLRVRCPHCQGVCEIPPHHHGQTAPCGQCGRLFTLPAQPPPLPPPQPEEDDEIGLVLDGPAALTPDGVSAPDAPVAVCRLDVGSATSPGRVRERNEDSCLVVQFTATNLDRRRDAALVVVADGVGGEGAGDQASGITVRMIGWTLLGPLAALADVQGQRQPPAGLAEQIAAAIRTANRTAHEVAQTAPGCKGMAATAAVVVVWEGQAYLGHVGDCRVYRFGGNGLEQLTKDQTAVARMVELGKLTPAEALVHPGRNEVLQAIGKRPDMQPSAAELKVGPGDWLIVACDGLHAHVGAKELEDLLAGGAPTAAAMAQLLVDRANEGGGSDNCTVVAVRCH